MKLVDVKWENERPSQFSFPNSAIVSAKVSEDSHLKPGTKVARLICPDTCYGKTEIEVNFSILGVRDSSPFDGIFGVTDEYLNQGIAQNTRIISKVKMVNDPTGLQCTNPIILPHKNGHGKVLIQFFTNPGEDWTPIEADLYEGYCPEIKGITHSENWRWNEIGELVFEESLVPTGKLEFGDYFPASKESSNKEVFRYYVQMQNGSEKYMHQSDVIALFETKGLGYPNFPSRKLA